MVATSLLLWPVAGTTPVYGVAAVVLGVAFLVEAHRLLRRAVLEADAAAAGHVVAGPSVEAGAMRLFHGSITYLTLLFLVDRDRPAAAVLSPRSSAARAAA